MLISGWSKWQTYRKDRGTPPWIKVYRNLFSNEEWASLSDPEKGQLVSLWILAADKHGVIPDDPIVLQKMCMLDNPPNISKFKDLGFMVASCQPSGDQVETIDQKVDAPETETETETETDKPFRALDYLKNLGVEKKIAKDWLKVRKNKRLANTETAFDSLKIEIDKTDKSANDIIKICAQKSWGGFKASWPLDDDISGVSDQYCENCGSGISCPWKNETNKPPKGKKCFSPVA